VHIISSSFGKNPKNEYSKLLPSSTEATLSDDAESVANDNRRLANRAPPPPNDSYLPIIVRKHR